MRCGKIIYEAIPEVGFLLIIYRTFLISNNEDVEELPADMFGWVSFQYIKLENVLNLRTVHPEAMIVSMGTLKELRIKSSLMEDFPWWILPDYTSLEYLYIHYCALTRLPALVSPSLYWLNVEGNSISALEAGWNTPTLKVLDMGEINSKMFCSVGKGCELLMIIMRKSEKLGCSSLLSRL